ncbi:phosphopantetheine-binding protein [Paenibacillus koleovorans]|uniref:phosphopantetheine-binding protein n=1 Tax=Paenibacillus koleovorans TaxID=121608 RepID=UPI0013E37123|nr:phosphopantetheine-binding protein [Paenibacillus koleovorans]
MSDGLIAEKVKDLLESLCGDDSSRIQQDIEKLGDAEVDSIYFVEIAPVVAQHFGIMITVNHIDQHAKRSFNDFCRLIGNLVSERR